MCSSKVGGATAAWQPGFRFLQEYSRCPGSRQANVVTGRNSSFLVSVACPCGSPLRMLSNSYAWRLLFASLLLSALVYVEASERLPEDSLAHTVEARVGKELNFTSGRGGFSVASFLTGWLAEDEIMGGKFKDYPPNTIGLSVGTNNYFDGTLISGMLKDGEVPDAKSVRSLANKRIQETANRIRDYFTLPDFHGLLDRFGGNLQKPTEQDVEWHWLEPVDHPFVPSSSPPIPELKSHDFHGPLVGRNVPLIGERLGLTQILKLNEDKDVADALRDKNEEVKTLTEDYGKLIKEIKTAGKDVLSDYPAAAQLVDDVPVWTHHHMYGGWFELRGLLVIKGLLEPTTSLNSLALPQPKPLTTKNFLHYNDVLVVLSKAMTELSSHLRAVYLIPIVKRFQGKPFLSMEWKDILHTSRMVAIGYNSQQPRQVYSAKVRSTGGDYYDWPSTSPVPAAALLVQQNPEMVWRLAQFGGAREKVLNGWSTVPDYLSDLDGVTQDVQVVSILLLVVAILHGVVGLCMIWRVYKKRKQEKEHIRLLEDKSSVSARPYDKFSPSLEMGGVTDHNGNDDSNEH
eukprot:GHVS01043871.1.p1 GENE.GHVS01043871.1~~GHVS01043871.1.p1  ORF type:complete len:594 (+),score=58.36 GHVS01043871.1:71-1783(+)